jgi:hypothetical protein
VFHCCRPLKHRIALQRTQPQEEQQETKTVSPSAGTPSGLQSTCSVAAPSMCCFVRQCSTADLRFHTDLSLAVRAHW